MHINFVRCFVLIWYLVINESGEDLDWIFETSGVATLEFLEWVCENLHEENVLSEAEIQEWEDLKRRSPESILSGSRLQVGKCQFNYGNFQSILIVV